MLQIARKINIGNRTFKRREGTLGSVYWGGGDYSMDLLLARRKKVALTPVIYVL